MSYALQWLAELAAAAPTLPQPQPIRAYYSQRRMTAQATPQVSLPITSRRVYQLVQEFEGEHFFSQTFGYPCIDDYGHTGNSPEEEFDKRLGKPGLLSQNPETWSEDDLYDLIEVFHDLAARPTRGSYHTYGNCGWHPTHFDPPSGQALYRWRVNRLLDTTPVTLRIAESGNDIGQMVQVPSSELGKVATDALQSQTTSNAEMSHAVQKFRSRHASIDEQRSAVRDLATVLEGHRPLLKDSLLKKDEGALFEIANRYNIRHRDANQYTEYGPEFLEWIFYWYLATIQLIEKMLARQTPT